MENKTPYDNGFVKQGVIFYILRSNFMLEQRYKRTFKNFTTNVLGIIDYTSKKIYLIDLT